MADEANTTDRAPPPAFLDAAFVQTALRNGGETDAHVDNIEMSADAQTPQRAPPPTWVDAAFVEQALRRGGGADAEARVEGIEVSYAIPVGDNYCSSILRVRARLRGAPPTSLLVKVLPGSGEWSDLVQESRVFVKEAQVFSRVLPAMEALLEAATPGRHPPFAPHCFHEGQEPSPFVVVQDLRPEGFVMLNRLEGLDLPHALLAVRALGRFHGASAAVWRRRPELFDGLVSIFEDKGCDTRSLYYPKCVERTANTIASWTDVPRDYEQKVRSLINKIFPKLQEVNRRRPGKFNVLIHGDFWTNNLLFNYKDNTVQNVRFVDFQLSHVGNPAIDLLLFRYTSLTEDVFDNHWETLLEAYRIAMAETLQALGEEVRTKDDILQDMEDGAAYAFLAAFIWLPSVKLDSGKLDLDKAVASDSSVRNLHTSPTVCRWLRKLLPHLIQERMFEKI